MPSSTTRAPVSRRRLLQLSGASAAVIALGIDARSARAEPSSELEGAAAPEGMFSLGVASGAPRPDGVVLWTRLAPEPLAEDGHGGMPLKEVTVRWEVATDEEFRGIVAHGRALAQPALAHAVHPRVEGLDPGTEHFYRFRAGRETAPSAASAPCRRRGNQRNPSASARLLPGGYHGHFTAHRHLAAEEDLDLVVFVGDYIYEYGITETNRGPGAEVGEAHRVEIETLEQYRCATPCSSPTRTAGRARPRRRRRRLGRPRGAEQLHRRLSDTGIPEDLFAHRIAVAYRAFYENMPLDVAALPDGTDTDITDGFDVGSLARFSLLDSRQFRDAKPADAAEQHREDRTILGTEQEEWVGERLASSTATWNLLANGVVLVPIDEASTDMWDGYPAARRRLLAQMAEASNPVMLTGDIHKHVAAEIPADPDDPAAGALGVELVCTSIASDGDGAADAGTPETWTRHEYVKLYDGRRGYVHVRLTPQEMVSSFRVVDWIEADDTAPEQLRARFTTPAGEPRLIPA